MTARAEATLQGLTHDYLDRYPDEVAAVLDPMPTAEVAAILEVEPPAIAASLLERVRADTAAAVALSLSDAAFARVIPVVDPMRAAAFLARLDDADRAQRLTLLPDTIATELAALMRYPPGSAGQMMDPRVPTFRPDTTVRATLGTLRKVRDLRARSVFVVDTDGRLRGIVPVQDLALAAPADTLEPLVQRAPASVKATASQEEVVEIVEQQKITWLPVVDFEERLLGVIRYDELVSAVEQNATADIATMVGASADERALSPIHFAVRKRLPWLQINLATAFLAAAVVGLFEATIAQFTALAVLLPVVAGQSGNTGAQALAVTMRGLALREIRVRHWLRVAVKEIAVGAIDGVAVAIVTSLGVYVWSQSAGLAMVIGTAMVGSMAIAGVAGATIPMMLTVLRQDPAQASSIILTTVTDVVGFLSFLGLATLASGLL